MQSRVRMSSVLLEHAQRHVLHVAREIGVGTRTRTSGAGRGPAAAAARSRAALSISGPRMLMYASTGCTGRNTPAAWPSARMRPKARKTMRMSARVSAIEMRRALGNLAHHQRRKVRAGYR